MRVRPFLWALVLVGGFWYLTSDRTLEPAAS